MKTGYLDLAATKLYGQLNDLMVEIQHASKEGIDTHKVESTIHLSLRSFGFDLLDMFFSLCGDGDQGAEIEISKGHTVMRLEKLHTRQYQSIYGEHQLDRVVYGTREGQKIECVPLDAEINLPESKFSYLLQDWDQSLIVDSPYAKVNETIEKILGFKQSVHSLERTNQKMSTSVNDFWDNSLPIPPEEQESSIFVCSVDGKGVPIRNDAKILSSNTKTLDKNIFDSSDKNEKTGGKKIALVGAVYTIDPYRRTPEEIVNALFHDKDKEENQTPRPKPMYKHIRASLLRSKSGTSELSYEEIFNWLADEEKNRNPKNEKDVICLMDGQDSLWKAASKALPDKDVVEILDLLHACGYIWEAAHIFHDKKSSAATDFAKTRILSILEGDVTSVVRGLAWMGTHEKLPKSKMESLNKIRVYLKNNAHRMKYNEYLAAGYPIASGVIEGACRYAVKDRMERTGMRWILQGAHAMLSLRCIHLSGYWEEFMAHRIKMECERIYPWRTIFCSNDSVYGIQKVA